MLNLIFCEIFKLKGSKVLLFSFIGILSTPCMMLIEALQIHYQHPEKIFTLTDIYSDSLLYVMLLTNLMIYIAITAFIFSREYAENTLKSLITIPITRNAFIVAKFLVLLLWILSLSFITWLAMTLLSSIFHITIGMHGFEFVITMEWLLKFLVSGVLVFLTIIPFAYLAERTKGFIAPMIISAIIVMGSVALCNHDVGAMYPWTASYFLLMNMVENSGYPLFVTISMIGVIAMTGFYMSIRYFKKEDL